MGLAASVVLSALTVGAVAASPASQVPGGSGRLEILVGPKAFAVTVYDNAATAELMRRLPLTLDMSELNGNEKYCYLPFGLPAASSQLGSIKSGDLMLYGSDCLVLFYESFSSSYSYTKLGYVPDVTGLAEALGKGSVQVTFRALK